MIKYNILGIKIGLCFKAAKQGKARSNFSQKYASKYNILN